MIARKIRLLPHLDGLLGRSTDARAVVIGALTSGSAQGPLSIDDMRKGKTILEEFERKGPDAECICLSEEQWAFVEKKVKGFQFAVGDRGVLAAVDDILDAEVVDVDERETNP